MKIIKNRAIVSDVVISNKLMKYYTNQKMLAAQVKIFNTPFTQFTSEYCRIIAE